MSNKINKPSVILFDLDDTIVSFDGVCRPAWVKICGDFTSKYNTDFSADELLNAIDKVKDWYWKDPVRHKWGREHLLLARRDVVRYALKDLNITDEDMVCEIADGYTKLQDDMIHMLPGAYEALDILKNAGIRMAVITNGASEVQRGKLERFGISHFFEKIYIDTEVGYSKPDIRLFQHVIKDMSINPEETWMVGDNLTWDIFGPRQVGIYAVWNDYDKEGLPDDIKEKPDLVVNSIFEMARIIITD